MREYDFDILWDEEHPELTERRLQDLLKQRPIEDDPHYHCQLLTQIARAQGLQRKFEAANKTLDHTLKVMRDMTSITFVRYLLERGRVYGAAEQQVRAKTFFREAWAMSNRVQADAYAIDAALQLASIQATRETQLEWCLRALQRARDTRDDSAKQSLSAVHERLGWVYHQLGEFESALDCFRQVVAVRQTQGNAKALSGAKWCVGRVLRSLDKCQDAYRIQQDLLAESQRMQRAVDGIIYEELGECLRCLGRPKEATAYYALAYATLVKDPNFCHKEPDRLNRIKTLAGED